MLEQDRINAVISYFFLGPLFLLAKKWTPLAAPYVQKHARESSKIIGITLIAMVVYFFIRGYIGVSFFGIDIRTLIITLIMWGCSVFLIRGAYKSYHGDDSIVEESHLISWELLSFHTSAQTELVDTEEERIRIFASHIPYIGIILAAKYQHPLMVRARIIGSFFMTVFLMLLFIGSGESFFAFIFMGIYIIFIIVEGISLFLGGRYLSYPLLTMIPSYREVEAHIITSVEMLGDFIRVIFGQPKTITYNEAFEDAKNYTIEPPVWVKPYFMPVALIGLPLWNIFTLPSFFTAQYRPYRWLILQGIIITLILIFGYIFVSNRDLLLLVFLFPIVHIFAYAKADIMTRTPIIGLIIRICENLWHKKKAIMRTEKSEKWSYQTNPVMPTETPLSHE